MLDCGRRWGKNVIGEDVSAEAAMAGWPVGWFAPEYRYLSESWRQMIKSLLPFTVRSNASEHRIELAGGGVIEMWSLDSGNAGRSRKYKRVVIDEAAMAPNLVSIWTDAIRPTLTDLKGDAWFMSTPKGKNDFYTLYQYGLDPLQEEWASWQFPTSSNPFIDSDEIEAARMGMPEDSFRQEYLAEFLEGGSVFRYIKEAAVARPQEYAQDGHASHPRHRYIVGVDWGQMEDFSVFAVIDATTKELCHLDRSRYIEYTSQVRRLKDLCMRFQVSRVYAEANAQATTIELLQQAGLPVTAVTMTHSKKIEIIEGLRSAFDHRSLKILDDQVLLGELQTYEAQRTQSNRLTYNAREGGHDDCVMALAIAWDAAKDDMEVRVEKYEVVRVRGGIK